MENTNPIRILHILHSMNRGGAENAIMNYYRHIDRDRNPFPYLRGVRRFLKEHPEYKIVHSHTSSKSVFPLAIARSCGVSVRCSHSHNSSSERGVNGLIRNALMPFLKLTATDYLACGDQAGEWLYGKKTFKKGKVQVFKNVIETDKFRLNMEIRKNYRHKFGFTDDMMVFGNPCQIRYRDKATEGYVNNRI